jgi:sugar lactone lactonase YvrE
VIVDGCCMDAEGAIWAADVRNAKCLRVLPGGEIAEEIAAPEGQNIFACSADDRPGPVAPPASVWGSPAEFRTSR